MQDTLKHVSRRVSSLLCCRAGEAGLHRGRWRVKYACHAPMRLTQRYGVTLCWD